jgi:predicted esterase/chitodextrinase
MKNIRVLGLFAICLFATIESLCQTDIYLSPVAPFRGLRTGTFSPRTTDGYNKANGSPKTWTFFDNTSWNSKFYNGDITKPAYTEGHSIIWGGDFDKNYRLLFPVAYNLPQNAGYKYPLILFVHGAGERGNCWGSGNSLYNTTSTSGSGGAMTSGSTTLTRTSGTFSSADLYKNILVTNAGPVVNSNPTNLITYITAVNSSTSVTLATAASTTVTGRSFNYGYGRTGTGSMLANSNILTSPTPIFNPNDVNSTIQVENGTIPLFDWCFPTPYSSTYTKGVQTITSVISSTQVMVTNPTGSSALNSVSFKFGLGTNPAFRGNDLSLVHAGNEHLTAVYTANGKLAEDPTLPTRGFPGFVLVPQNEDGSTYDFPTFNALLDLLISQYNIDPDRIYIHGLSNGGGGSWQIMYQRPELYAAILPMSGVISPGDPMFSTGIQKLVPIPSWSFQGGVDGNPTPYATNQIQGFLKAAGATPRFTLYPTVGHGTWGFAYAEPDFFSWMLKQNKRNITVLYGDSTLCPTDNSGVKLALSTGFLAYQWELDGAIMSSVPLTSSTITVTQPGTYRARFSRVSANPSGSQWNAWSKPVVIRETSATAPVVIATGTSHLPDINGGTTVRINGPTKKDLTKNWYINNSLSINNPLISYPLPASPTNHLDSTNYTIRNTAGVVTLKTLALDACSSLVSNSIYVTVGVTPTLTVPASPSATAISANSVQLFWTDNTPNETGFEIYRATNASGPYNFFKLVNAGTISYTDTGLSPATTYYYKLRAVNNTDVSNYTGNVNVVTPGDTQPPTAPQNLASGLKTLTSINLSWTASTDNTGIQQYQITYSGTTSGTINTSSTATTYNVTGLIGNTNYAFTVKAIDLANNVSQSSNQIVTSTIFSGLNYSYSAVNSDLLTDVGNNWNTPELTGTCANFDITLRKQDDYFNFKFEGYISLPAGDYNFRSQSDDGSMVFMGGEGDSDFPFDPGNPIVASNFLNNRVFDNDGLHGCGPAGATPSTINFSGNAARPITVIMFEKTGGECLIVEYKLATAPNNAWVTIPNSVLNSGGAPALTPPAIPTGLAAVAAGMSSINLNWSPTSYNTTPYPSNLKVVVLGSSTAVGTGASSTANSWVGKLDAWLTANTTTHTLTNLAVGGFTTYHVRADGSTGPTLPDVNHNITKALSLNPNIILVNLPSNNVANSIPITTTMSHYAELKALADMAGIPILFTTTQPRDFSLGSTDTGLRHLLQDEAVAIRSAYGNSVIDIYDYLTDFTNDNRINTAFSSLPYDGIHLNDTGHDYIFNKALSAMLSQYQKYEVYRSTDNSNFTIISTAGINSFGDTNLLPSTTYYYKLKATSSGGSSAFSSTVSAMTTGDNIAPSVPIGVTILSSNYTGVGVQWTASTDNVAVTGYKIYANGTLLGTSPTVTYSTTALLPGTPYAITVSAYDASGNTSAQSVAANFTTSAPLTFYSKPSSDLSLTASWGTNADGTGTIPTSFAYDGQYFKIPSPQTQTLSNPLTIGGTISRVFVDDGASLTISQPLTGTLKVGSGSTLNVNVDYQPVFETIDPTSTINFNTYSAVPIATYGNLNLTGSGLKSVAAGTLEVLGNLTLASGVGIKGAASNGTTVKVAKDLITGSSVATVSSDNRVTLLFSGTAPQNLTVSTDQAFYKISTTATANVTFNASAKTLNLGSTNGGGLDLATGSTLILGNNNLTLTDKAMVNPTNTTGKISITNSNISLTTSAPAASPSNFYFASSPNNKVQNFMLLATGGSTTNIGSGLEIYDGLKVNNGILNASGNITLKSSATANASIQQIVSGSITGNVNVERYMSPKRVYRYLSSPVAGAKVADWQNYFPITGGFIGGTGNASFFYYTEPAYVAYPTTAMDNTAPLQVGRGYAAFIREGTNPTTLVTTGVPNQGTIAFTLTGGTGSSSDGYNLVGNPYASDVVWRNSGWSSSGISNIVAIRENYAGGGYAFTYYDRTIGTGKIPAGQAFWVQATTSSPSLSVTEAAKTTDPASGNTNFFRTETVVSSSLFKLKLSNGPLQDYAFVNLTEEGSDLYDKVRDGAKRPNSFFNLSTASIDSVSVSLAINDAGNSFCEKTIGVNLQPGENLTSVAPGSYTLQFENLENFSYATIQLVDAFLGTTTSIDKNSSPYALTVTADASSYTNRLSLKLTRPSIVTNNLLTAAKDNYCSSEESVVLTINNSQAGVTYEAVNANTASLSQKVIGTGDNISLTIPVKNLGANQNTIRVQSNFAGCSSVLLANTKVITINDLPSINTQLEVSGCVGGRQTLIASGTGKTYQWIDQNTNQILPEVGKTIQVTTLNPINPYKVTSISDKGCQSEPKNILVRAYEDALATPNINLTPDGVLLTDATKNVQWLLNGTVLSGANTSSYNPTQSGLYSVQAQNATCTKESPTIEYLVTGIENAGNDSFSLTVFPNPSETGEITVIGNSSLSNELQIQITDVVGRELVNKTISTEEFKKGSAIETSWAKGIYIVRVTQDNLNLHQKVIIR